MTFEIEDTVSFKKAEAAPDAEEVEERKEIIQCS